jgi:predicted XRE-type DNA-binding protein
MDGEEQIGPEVELPGKRIYFREDDPRFAEIASQRGYSQEAGRIQKVRYTHDAMIDIILADPTVKQAQLATIFGVTQPWISRIVGSDAFQAVLAKRRSDITDPIIMASMEDKLRGVADQSLEILADKLQATQSADLALKTLGLATTALGFGARDKGAPVQNNFVVNLPPKAASADDWALRHAPMTIEARPFSSTVVNDPTEQPRDMRVAKE